MPTTTTAVPDEELERDPVWGPMSHPTTLSIADGSAPWKDHIYLGFWDTTAKAYGFLHWNSSPNHNTGKAQLCGSFRGRVLDLKEDLRPGKRFTSASLDFDLSREILIDSEEIAGELIVSPRFSPHDYTQNSLLPPLVEGEPLQHWQQGCDLRGELRVGGERLEIAALGYRTRMWGFRDDSNQFQEYVSLQMCLAERDITCMKFRWPDGSLKTDGFLVTADSQTPVVDMHVVRNPSGLTSQLRVELAGGETITFDRRGVAAGLWCPIGLPAREGPTFSAYDEVIDWELNDGERAYSLVEQAIVRHVF
jgi:hypothetical protein